MKKQLWYKTLACVLVVCMLSANVVAVHTDEMVKVYLNDEQISFDVEPRIINGRAMVPVKVIFEKLGAEVKWENETQTVVSQKGDVRVTLRINDNAIYVDGERKALDCAAMLIDGRTLVPVRAISEAFHYQVDWDGDKNAVLISGENDLKVDGITFAPTGEPVLRLSDDSSVSLGLGIKSTKINAKGELIFTYTNGQEINLGVVRGSGGGRGRDGADGEDGTDGLTPFIGENGNWWIGTTDTGVKAAGTAGDPGAQGPQGEKGDKGDPGAQGPQGEKGDKGDTGAQGPQGEKGDKGDTGAQGPQGEKGDKGDPGAQGPQGEKGDKGDPGAQGPQGEKGDKGDPGAQGLQGEKGEKGEKGDKGNPGTDGVGIAKVEIVDGCLWITYTNNLENPVNVGALKANVNMEEENFVYVLLDDGTYGIKASDSFALTTVEIPSIYQGIAVTQIMENGFDGQTGITNVIFPETLKKIGRCAFQNCAGLTEIEIPASVEFIGARAFYNAALTSATFSVTDWVVGADGFSYIRFLKGNPCLRTYDIGDDYYAAMALKGPAEVWFGSDRDNYQLYLYKYWFAVDWERI